MTARMTATVSAMRIPLSLAEPWRPGANDLAR
jgi:hypothetical protein